MTSIEITTLDLAKFYHSRNITLKKRSKITIDLWKNRQKFLEYYMYDTLRIFVNELDNLLMDLSHDSIIFKETEEILRDQDDLDLNYIGYGFYKLNKNKTEDFLKQCKLRIMYESKQEYIYMKMRTLVNSCGYKRRGRKFVDELNAALNELKLYMTDGDYEYTIVDRYDSMKIMNIYMDNYIRIYSY